MEIDYDNYDENETYDKYQYTNFDVTVDSNTEKIYEFTVDKDYSDEYGISISTKYPTEHRKYCPISVKSINKTTISIKINNTSKNKCDFTIDKINIILSEKDNINP